MTSFQEFETNDYLVLEEMFDEEDFARFEKISGDSNRLHHEKEYASKSIYGQPIVPIFLITSKLSAIAGMFIPGEPSLILNYEVNARKACMYGEKTIYSAKITSIFKEERVIIMKILVMQKNEINVEVDMKVKCRHQEWNREKSMLIKNSNKEEETVLIIGGTSEIGKCVVNRLIKKGNNLILTYRSDNGYTNEISGLVKEVENENVKLQYLDLCKKESLQAFIEHLTKEKYIISRIIYLASPRVEDPLEEHVTVNYKGMRDIVEAVLPVFLKRQKGNVVYMSTIYTTHKTMTYADYAATKTMGEYYMKTLNKEYSNYGLKIDIIAPYVVNTRFSEKSDAKKLTKYEVAENILELPKRAESIYKIINIGSSEEYFLGRQENSLLRTASEHKEQNTEESSESSNKQIEYKKELERIFAKQFPNIKRLELEKTGIDITPGWDSMSQIIVLSEIEAIMGIRFNSNELANLTSYVKIENAIHEKFNK